MIIIEFGQVIESILFLFPFIKFNEGLLLSHPIDMITCLKYSLRKPIFHGYT